jgi:hypothetical protein
MGTLTRRNRQLERRHIPRESGGKVRVAMRWRTSRQGLADRDRMGGGLACYPRLVSRRGLIRVEGNVKQHSNCNLNLMLFVAGSAVVAMLAACGASSASQIPIHKPGPGLSTATRSVTVKPYDMAYGRPTGFASARLPTRPSVNIDDYLLPSPRAPRSSHPALPVPLKSRPEQLAALPAPKAAEAPVAGQQYSSGDDLETLMTAAEAPQSNAADLDRYAQRDRQSNELQKYRGGDAIVITATTLIIILLVVVLLILLT